jgi:hypothetical protein
MRVLFERSGGFAGRALRREVDCAGLPEAEATRLREVVRQAGFFGLPGRISSSGPGADRFHYRVTVESESDTHTVDMDESAVPPSVRPLLDFFSIPAKNPLRRKH